MEEDEMENEALTEPKPDPVKPAVPSHEDEWRELNAIRADESIPNLPPWSRLHRNQTRPTPSPQTPSWDSSEMLNIWPPPRSR